MTRLAARKARRARATRRTACRSAPRADGRQADGERQPHDREQRRDRRVRTRCRAEACVSIGPESRQREGGRRFCLAVCYAHVPQLAQIAQPMHTQNSLVQGSVGVRSWACQTAPAPP